MFEEWVRYYNIAVSVVVAIVGTPQLRTFLTLGGRRQLSWQALILFNLTAFWGSIEALRAGAHGGIRMYLLAIAITWLLAAVLIDPITHWRARRAHFEETK